MERIISGPDFFTVMSSDLNTEILTIPPHFRNHIVNELSERATLKLKNSSYCSWNVRVHKTEEGGICFKEGWKEFLQDTSLDGEGDFEFLVIEYGGHMHFKIQPYLSVQIGTSDQNSVSFSSGHNPYSKSKEFAALSKYPTFRTTVKYRWVDIPVKFCKKYIPLGHYTVILKNSEGATWNVTGYPKQTTMRLGAGWLAFRKANKADEGDVCVFELESKDKTVVIMVVHIFSKTSI
ncbi:hypothetical protein ABKV19_023543 [Rosa sericea]